MPDMVPETPNKKIQVLIADDHQLMGDAVATVLEEGNDFHVQVVETFDSVIEAIEQGKSFDIILLDVLMPGMSGLDSVRRLLDMAQDTAVVIFSGNALPDFVMSAIEMGARGYIPKTLPLKSLAAALRLVNSGQVFLPVSLMSSPNVGGRGLPGRSNKQSALSTQETNLLGLVAAGKTNKQIAREVGLSEVTVKMHMRSIFAKLGANNRTHAVMIAQARHIL